MIKITPYQISYYNNQKKKTTSFTSESYASLPSSNTTAAKLQKQTKILSGSSTLNQAAYNLNGITFDKQEAEYLQSLGIVLPFQSGKEALDFVKTSNVWIKFASLPPNIHAQYHWEDNSIQINDLYKNTKNPAVILAISESILHEAGHAKDKDSESSVQEEIDCLSMNVLAHRALLRKSPNIFANENALIVKDGVCVYSDLFFEKDTNHSNLIERLKQKYGTLPAGDIKHSPGELALKVKNEK